MRAGRLDRAALRFIALRVGLLLLAVAPTMAGAWSTLAGGVARSAYLAAAPHPLPFAPLFRLWAALGSAAFSLVASGAVIGVLLQLPLFARLVEWRTAEGRGSSAAASSLDRHFFSLCRVALLAALLLAGGALLIAEVAERVIASGASRGWSLHARVVVAPAIAVVSVAIWGSLVGVWATAAKVLTVIGERRVVRRTAVIAARLVVRAPSLGLFSMGVSLSSLVVLGAILLEWRRREPSGLALLGWVTLFITALFATGVLWHWWVVAQVRVAEGQPDLLAGADVPFGGWRRALDRARAVQRRWLGPRSGLPDDGLGSVPAPSLFEALNLAAEPGEGEGEEAGVVEPPEQGSEVGNQVDRADRVDDRQDEPELGPEGSVAGEQETPDGPGPKE